MAFEIVPVARFGPSAITPGSCRLRGDGIAVVHGDAARQVGINGVFVLLLDKDTKRIAVRRVHEDDLPEHVVHVRKAGKAQKGDVVLLPVASAMRMAGWVLPDGKSWRYHGRQTVVCREDGLLIICMENPPEKNAGRK